MNAVSTKTGGGLNDLVSTLPLLREWLGDNNWNVHTWVVQPGWDALIDAGYPAELITCVHASSPIGRAIWEKFRFPYRVRCQRPNVVFHFSNFILSPLSVPQLTVLRSVVYFSEVYNAHPKEGIYQKFWYRIGCRNTVKTFERAARLFCISATQRQDIVRTLGSLGEKVEVSHVGFKCPHEATSLIGQDRPAIMAQLPRALRTILQPLQDPKRRIVVNIGDYYEYKNLSDLLQAMVTIGQDRPELALILTTGIVPYQSPTSRPSQHDVELARILASRGQLFDLGKVRKDNVWKLLALADVFAFPSALESFGHPLLEAASMGVPIVASDTPIHLEVTGGNALFHRLGDSAGLAEKLLDVLDQHVDIESICRAGRARTAEFSWEKHVTDLGSAIVDLAR